MLPLRTVFAPLLPALRGDGIVAPPGAGAVLPPIGADEPALLQPLEGGVQGGLLQAVFPPGELLDIFIDLISIVVTAEPLCYNDGVGVPPQELRLNGH